MFGTAKNSTHGFVQEDPVLARYDASFQRDVRQIATEDPGR